MSDDEGATRGLREALVRELGPRFVALVIASGTLWVYVTDWLAVKSVPSHWGEWPTKVKVMGDRRARVRRRRQKGARDGQGG